MADYYVDVSSVTNNANEVDVNVKSNNDSPVYGSGTPTDKWRGEL